MAAREEVSIKPESSAKEHIRLLVIFAVLVALIALPAWLWTRHEKNRPSLVEVRVVSATSEDPVFREGARSVESDETVRLAVVLRLNYPGKGDIWLCPGETLVLDGHPVDHVRTNQWPEEDRIARVFWFTLEAPVLGGKVTQENAPEKLALRTFFAPELGRGLLAEGEPESHADDGVNLGDELLQVNAGTYRLYARAEVVSKASSSHPLYVATSLGTESATDPRLLRISRRLDADLGLDPEAGELFRLPGFEIEQGSDMDIHELVRDRLATSSQTFAATAVTGGPSFENGEFKIIASPGWDGETLSYSGPALQWGSGIRTRNVIRQGQHWMVAIRDDGDGIFGSGDLVVHSWRRHAALLPLGSALEEEPVEIGIFQFLQDTP